MDIKKRIKEKLNESTYQSKLAKANGLKHVGNGIYRSAQGVDYKYDVSRFVKVSNSKPEKDSMRYSTYAEKDDKLKKLGASSFTYGNIYKNKNGDVFRLGDDGYSIEKMSYTYNGKMVEKDADGISGNDLTWHTFKDSSGKLYVFDSDADIMRKINPKKYTV